MGWKSGCEEKATSECFSPLLPVLGFLISYPCWCEDGREGDVTSRTQVDAAQRGATERGWGGIRAGTTHSSIYDLCHYLHRLYNGRAKGRQFGSKCNSGDRIGCGIEPVSFDVQTAQIFFTKNGKRVSGQPREGSSGRNLPEDLWGDQEESDGFVPISFLDPSLPWAVGI